MLLFSLSVSVLGGCGADAGEGSGANAAIPAEKGEAMHVVFERSGGFAGITRTARLDSGSLTPDAQAELSALIDQADFFELPAQILSDPPIPDDFLYSIEIDAGDGPWTVVTSDIAMPDQLRPLVEWLTNTAR